jgi:DNA-binding response OmpR family regulator
VLVAEGDESLGKVLVKRLRDQGYVVDFVRDGETALSYSRWYEYSVAVVGWRIPRMSGIDVVHRLRRRGTHTPVLMLSDRNVPAERVAGLDAGRTTSWSSRSTSASCWPGCARCSAAPRRPSRRY